MGDSQQPGPESSKSRSGQASAATHSAGQPIMTLNQCTFRDTTSLCQHASLVIRWSSLHAFCGITLRRLSQIKFSVRESARVMPETCAKECLASAFSGQCRALEFPCAHLNLRAEMSWLDTRDWASLTDMSCFDVQDSARVTPENLRHRLAWQQHFVDDDWVLESYSTENSIFKTPEQLAQRSVQLSNSDR